MEKMHVPDWVMGVFSDLFESGWWQPTKKTTSINEAISHILILKPVNTPMVD
jgi:hypothetical protein